VGPNVYVNIPIANTKAESAVPLLRRLAPNRNDAVGAGFTL
jgi:hypothetical protein